MKKKFIQYPSVKSRIKAQKKKEKEILPESFESGPNYFVQQSDFGGKGGRASRGEHGEYKTEEDLVKDRR